MVRLLLVATLSLGLVGDAFGWNRRRAAAYPVCPTPLYTPTYPLTPAIWGAPAPAPLPPLPPPSPPKPAAGIREGEGPPAPPKPLEKPKEEKLLPKIPKLDLPLPGDATEPDPGLPKKDKPEASKKNPTAQSGKAVEQFLVPATVKRAEPRAEVQVGFFNHSERAIELQVNGEAVQLPSEQYVTLRLPRTFTWAEKGQKGADVVVPPDADGVEIVFRK
jgi:hypothetical protein